MQRTDVDHIVLFTEDEVREMILEKIRAEGITAAPIAFQTVTFATVWNGPPQITVILSNMKE